MRLMMVEYTYTPGPLDKGPVVHGVCNRRRLEHIIEEGSIVAKMIEDEYAAALQAKWEGDIEPTVKTKTTPAPAAPFVDTSADFKPFKANPTVSGNTMAPSMPPSGIGKK